MADKARWVQRGGSLNSVTLRLLEDGWRLCLEHVTERQRQVCETEVNNKADLTLLEFRFQGMFPSPVWPQLSPIVIDSE